MKKAMAAVLCALFVAASYGEEKNLAVTFSDAADLAVAYSFDLKAAKAGKALREGAWKLGLRAYLPQLNLSVYEDDRLSLMGSDSFLKNYTLSLEQLLWDGGRTASARREERAELALLAGDIDAQASEIAEAALEAYRAVLIARLIIEIRETALESLSEQRRILAEELRLGMATPLDLAQAEVTVRVAENELAGLRIELAETERSFAELLGLDEMPRLADSIDAERAAVAADAETARRAALSRYPALLRERNAIQKAQAAVKSASLSWLPTLKAVGSFTVSGQTYPLTRHSWSAGFVLSFDAPYLSGSTSGNFGWEPPYDKTARMQAGASPLPDPAASFSLKQARLALALERENYRNLIEQTGRGAKLAVEKIELAEQKRLAALAAAENYAEKFRINELLLGLGRITRIDLMEVRIDQAEKEVEAVQAAASLLAAERELEVLLNLKPGALIDFVNRADFSRRN